MSQAQGRHSDRQEAGRSLLERVAAFIDRHRLLEPADAVVVGVSGGSDSTALLAVLVELAALPQRGYRLVAAHLNHGLREAAQEDARFIADLADRLRVPCVCERADVPAVAAAAGVGPEEAGRRVRYEFLRRAALATGCLAIATGHQTDDQAETVLHRILRGTGLEGLAGIRPLRQLEGGLRLVRPLLAVTRQEAQAYLRLRGLAWRTDSTNADPAYSTRNRIRLELLPLLRERYNPRVDAALARLAELAAGAAPCLEELGRCALDQILLGSSAEELALNAAGLSTMEPTTAALAVRAALHRLEVPMQEIGQAQVQKIQALAADGPDGPTAADLPGGLRACRRGDRLVLSRRAGGEPVGPEPADLTSELPIDSPGSTRLPDGSTLHVEFRGGGQEELRTFLPGKDPCMELLDADRLAGALRVRRWRAGDQFGPLGTAGHQKLSDFFIGTGVSPADRRGAWLVCDDQGIVWLAPHRLAHRVQVTDQTRRLAMLRLERG